MRIPASHCPANHLASILFNGVLAVKKSHLSPVADNRKCDPTDDETCCHEFIAWSVWRHLQWKNKSWSSDSSGSAKKPALRRGDLCVRFCREMDSNNPVASELVHDRFCRSTAKKLIFASQWQDQRPWKGSGQKYLEQQVHSKALTLWRRQSYMNPVSNQNRLRQQKRKRSSKSKTKPGRRYRD